MIRLRSLFFFHFSVCGICVFETSRIGTGTGEEKLGARIILIAHIVSQMDSRTSSPEEDKRRGLEKLNKNNGTSCFKSMNRASLSILVVAVTHT